MDGIALLTKKLENTLEIIMDHFHDTDQRIEDLQDQIEELKNGTTTVVDERVPRGQNHALF